MKVVVNRCHGGFGLSDLAYYGLRLCGWKNEGGEDRPEFRSDPEVVAIVEQLGEAANGYCAQLEVVEIPDKVKWHIEEHGGMEWVVEKHRRWPS